MFQVRLDTSMDAHQFLQIRERTFQPVRGVWDVQFRVFLVSKKIGQKLLAGLQPGPPREAFGDDVLLVEVAHLHGDIIKEPLQPWLSVCPACIKRPSRATSYQ